MNLFPSLNKVLLYYLILLLASCGSGSSSAAEGASDSSLATVNLISSESAAARFLAFASMGATQEEVTAMVGRDAADWLQAEFDKPATLRVPDVFRFPVNSIKDRQLAPYFGYVNTELFKSLVLNDDQLRTRMTLALSQILVVSGFRDQRPARAMEYVDTLSTNAFGNYRQLLEEVTLTSAMGNSLTYRSNRKGDPATGRVPDENYARELLQLFSLGLVELNNDGTLVLDSSNKPIELYDNEDIVNLARVFTGYNVNGSRFDISEEDPIHFQAEPMRIFEEEHSSLEKNFLDVSIPANTSGEASLQLALDGIFGHPNVGPFIGRQLIQRFTASSPTPDYVERVTTAFNTGVYTSSNGTVFGTGNRGDLEATLAAILLDASMFEPADTRPVDTGKVQEPLLNFVRWMRIFKVKDFEHITRERHIRDMEHAGGLQMSYFQSPSVFNFYRPGYVAPNTQTGDLGLTVPEFQLFDTTLFLGYSNFMADFVYDDSPLGKCLFTPNLEGRDHNPCRFDPNNKNSPSLTPDYTAEKDLADSPTALVEHLDILLTGGRMSDDIKDEIVAVVEVIDLTIGGTEEDRERDERAKVAIFMSITSPAFMVFN